MPPTLHDSKTGTPPTAAGPARQDDFAGCPCLSSLRGSGGVQRCRSTSSMTPMEDHRRCERPIATEPIALTAPRRGVPHGYWRRATWSWSWPKWLERAEPPACRRPSASPVRLGGTSSCSSSMWVRMQSSTSVGRTSSPLAIPAACHHPDLGASTQPWSRIPTATSSSSHLTRRPGRQERRVASHRQRAPPIPVGMPLWHASIHRLGIRGRPCRAARTLLPPEVDEDAAKVVGVLLDPVVKALDVLAVQEAQNPLLELTRALPGDDLNQGRLLLDRLVDDGSQRSLDLIAPVVDVVQVELELHN